MSEEIDVLRIVTERLDGAGISYMVTGALALSMYAIPRMTRDVDLVVELSADDTDRVCALFGPDFYADPDVVGAEIVRRGTFNLIHEALVVKVDIIVRKDSDYRRTEFLRRRRLSFEGHRLFVVSPEDLIISKLDWVRDSRSAVQLEDVQHLLRLVPDLDPRTRRRRPPPSVAPCSCGSMGMSSRRPNENASLSGSIDLKRRSTGRRTSCREASIVLS